MGKGGEEGDCEGMEKEKEMASRGRVGEDEGEGEWKRESGIWRWKEWVRLRDGVKKFGNGRWDDKEGERVE